MAEDSTSSLILYIVCATVPFLAGLSTGLSGAGAAILFQILYRLAVMFYGELDLGETEVNRRILAFITICNISSYPPLFWRLYRTGKYEFRKDLVLFMFPGLNGLIFFGTFAATVMDGAMLGIFIGFILLFVAIYQFYNQSIRNRHVDDVDVRSRYEQRINNSTELHEFTNLDDLGSSDLNETEIIINENSSSQVKSDDVEELSDHTILDQNEDDDENKDDDDTNTTIDSTSLDKNKVQYDVADLPWIFSHNFLVYCQQHSKHILTSIAVSCLGGFLGGLCGINGPTVMIYLSLLSLTGGQLRETVLMVFGLNIPLTVVSRLYFGVLRSDEWLLYLIVSPVNFLGLKLGQHLQQYCDTRLVLSIFQFLTLLASIPLTTTLGKSQHRPLDIVMIIIYIILFSGIIAFITWRLVRNKKIKRQVQENNVISAIENVF